MNEKGKIWYAVADDSQLDLLFEKVTYLNAIDADLNDTQGNDDIDCDESGGISNEVNEYNVIYGGIGALLESYDVKKVFEKWVDYLVEEYGDDEYITELILEDIALDILGEATYRDLRNKAPDFLNIRKKSEKTPGSKYLYTDEEYVVHFHTPSHRIDGVVYEQRVKLLELDDLIRRHKEEYRPIKIVRMAIKGDIAVHCTDPSWKYWGFQYIGTRNDYAIEPEPRYPKIRNPYLKGSVCKHLDNVLFILPFQVPRIVKDLKKLGKI